MRNYGLILETQAPEDYKSGDGNLGSTLLNPEGDWRPFIPFAEYQNLGGIEPYACVSFGHTNAIETLIFKQFEFKTNWSDRFIAKASDTQVGGNSPHKVAEYIRKLGLVEEGLWPFSPEIQSFADYYQTLPPKLFQQARQFLAEYTFKHAWVPKEALRDSLKFSPIGISVAAWFKGEDGLYYAPDGVQDNHWCLLVYSKKGEYDVVFDSYPDDGETFKKLVPDMRHSMAKRYEVKKNQRETWFAEILKRFFT